MSGVQKTRSPFRVLMPALKRHAASLLLAMLAACGGQAIGLTLPLLARTALHHATQRKSHATLGLAGIAQYSLATFAVVLAVLLLLRMLLRWQQGRCAARLAQRVIADVRAQMYRHLQGLSAGYFDRRASGKILVRFVGDANALQAWLARLCVTVPADVLTLLGIGAAIGLIQLDLLLAALAPLVVVVPVLLWINPQARRWTREGRKQQTRLCGHLNERITALKVIRAANAQAADHAETAGMIDGVADANLKRAGLDAWSQALAVAGTTASVGAVVLCGAWLLGNGATTHADLMACLWLTLNCRGPLSRLGRANMIHQRARVAVERIHMLLSREPEPGWSTELRAYAGPGGAIRLKNVGYRTPEGQWLLRHVNRTLTGPGLVAVSDHLGQAKSALLELLVRLRRPHEGRIYLDSQDVRELRVADLRRQLGWVDAGATIVDTLGAGPWPDGQSEDDTAQAALWRSLDLVAPAGRVGDDAAASPAARSPSDRRHLPRAQRLRLALYYVLSRRPSILLLDEPTGGLTAEGAARFVQWLKEAAGQQLIIVATQDPRVVAAAGQQLTLEGGSEVCEPVAALPCQPLGADAGRDGDTVPERDLRPIAAEE